MIIRNHFCGGLRGDFVGLITIIVLIGFRVSAAERCGATAAQPQIIELFVNEPWLTAMREGTKPGEGRADPRSAFAGWIGREIRYYSKLQEVIVKVSGVHHYDTLDAFLEG